MAFDQFTRDSKYHSDTRHLSFSAPSLSPSRIVNRALYGTDYDPKDVSVRAVSPSKVPNMNFMIKDIMYETFIQEKHWWQ